MKTDDFNYELPSELIAQSPIYPRSSSKLLLMDKNTGDVKDDYFYNIIDYLNKDDILVLNNTKVIPARLIGEKTDTHAVIELLLLKNIEKDKWECLAKPAKRLHVGTIVKFGDLLKAKVIEKKEMGEIVVEFEYDGIFMEILDKLGSMPLPPYIHEKLEKNDRYQTIYAKYPGSAAAPTAGLHFTQELLDDLKNKGVVILYVTLHVGLGTFRPVEVDDITKHKMHTEEFFIDSKTAEILNEAKNNNKKIYAVGTTTTRVLESVVSKYKKFVECHEETNIFIYPGYKFKAIDGLITNFHLPKSTLLMLVSALSKKEYILNAYDHAIKEKYRFFSFGDAMFINDFSNSLKK